MKMKSLRLTTLLVASFALVWASAAQSVVHSLSGNARFQIGNGLPLPITGQPPPNGRILPASAGAKTVMQTAGMNPKQITLPPGALTAPGNAVNIPVFLANSKVFQVKTAIPYAFPRSMTASGAMAGSETFMAGGRTGGTTEAYCAGSGSVPPFNCTDPANGAINGLMRYTATKNQFGGPMRGNAGGTADVAVRGGDAAPCTYGGGANKLCIASMALATPQGTGAQGASFGVTVGTSGMAPASGKLYITVTAAGSITNAVVTPGMGAGLPNPALSYGGPWTTGMLTISVTNNVGPTPEIFMISGSDRRAANGRGALSLVSGSVSTRGLTGPNANRGWLNLQIGAPVGAHVPVMPAAGLAAFGALAALTGGYALRKRNR